MLATMIFSGDHAGVELEFAFFGTMLLEFTSKLDAFPCLSYLYFNINLSLFAVVSSRLWFVEIARTYVASGFEKARCHFGIGKPHGE